MRGGDQGDTVDYDAQARPRRLRRIAAGLVVGAMATALTVVAAAPASAVGSAQCAAGESQLDFVNASGIPDSDIYGTVVTSTGTVTPSGVMNASPSLALPGNFPTDPSDASGHTYYICLQSGITSGRLWLSIGAPIVGLPGTQPTITAPYRFGYIEFSYPGQTDYSNVNDFDFPISLRTYAAPGDTTPAEQADFSANTCQIVNAMRDAVAAVPGADWSQILDPGTDGFLRIISPDNDPASSTPSGWPDLTPYVMSLVGETITVQDYYVGGGVDPGNDGSLGSDSAPGAATGPNWQPAGLELAVSAADLAAGIYSQQVGGGYTIGGVTDTSNDVYARLWNDLTSAFAFGYWGSAYGTGLDTQDFFATFPTPGTTAPSGGQPAFTPARTIPYPATVPAGGISYNLYASVLSRFSPNYSFPFDENYGSGGAGTNPLLDVPTDGLITATLTADGWDGAPGSTTCAAFSPTGGPTLPVTGPERDTGIVSMIAAALLLAGAALALFARRAVRRRQG